MKRTSLRFRIVTVLLAVSLVPLCLMGVGAWIVFGRLLDGKALELQRTIVQSHARAIDAYLSERIRLLQQVVFTNSSDEMKDANHLNTVFDALNQTSSGGFADLGVIDAGGTHLSYTGPFDLKDKNYSDADWFKEVMAAGVHISDVFLGFRGVPHCVIAVKARNGSEPWILRATINSNQFDSIVRTGELGKSGDAFILNSRGLYQTAPKVGLVLDAASLPEVTFHRGVRDSRIVLNERSMIQVTTWLNGGRWVLVVLQDAAEVRAPVTRAFTAGAFVVFLAVILVVITTFIATGHLTAEIDKANAQREEMFRAFMRSAKLASIGELATGLAHEINNPLAVISAERTNIADVVQDIRDNGEARGEVLESTNRIKNQVERCASITTKMLQFGRSRETTLEPTDVAPRLQDIVGLWQRQASVRNVDIVLDVASGLPRVLVDPVEFEQVLVNLIHNAFDAMPEGGQVRLRAWRDDNEVVLEVGDDGCGMTADVLDRIFEPFFTTKPVGKGTGLGMSICYGIVHSWGGRLEAESEPGRGTTIRIHLPQPERSQKAI